MNTKLFLKRHASTILSLAGSAGIIATVVVTNKATLKASKLLDEQSKSSEELTKAEQVKAVLPIYIPVIVVAGASIAAVMGANVLNKRAQASLISAYALLNSTYNEYKDGVKRVYGEEGHEAVMKDIAKAKVEDVHIVAVSNWRNTNLDFDNESPDSIHLFYDEFSKQYFESTVDKVLQAEYHLNRNFVLRGDASLTEFYQFLGLKLETKYDEFGWSINDEMYWIDFNHYKTTLDDGLECYIIEIVYTPEANYMDY